METRGKRKVYYDPDSDEDGRERGDRAADQPLRNSSAAGSAGPSKQSKTRHEETDADEHEDDKLSEEALKKQLKTVTDEREIKRIKRLLRNRVSAQQARERKKQYVSELEQKLQVKDDHITRLSRDLRRAATTNATLRRLIQTMRPGSATPVPPVVGHAVASSEHPPGGSSDGSGGATSDGAGVAPVPTGEPIGPLNGWNSGLDMAARAEQTGLGGRVAAPGSQQCPLRSGAVSPPQPQPSGSKHVAAHESGPRLIPVSAASAPGQVGAPAGMQEWMGMGVPGMCPDPRPELCGQAWQVHSSRPGEG